MLDIQDTLLMEHTEDMELTAQEEPRLFPMALMDTSTLTDHLVHQAQLQVLVAHQRFHKEMEVLTKVTAMVVTQLTPVTHTLLALTQSASHIQSESHNQYQSQSPSTLQLPFQLRPQTRP